MEVKAAVRASSSLSPGGKLELPAQGNESSGDTHQASETIVAVVWC
jgi:hypothetical protein